MASGVTTFSGPLMMGNAFKEMGVGIDYWKINNECGPGKFAAI